MCSELRARNLGLNAGGEVLHGKDTGLKLVLAQDDNGPRDLVGSLERFLEPKAAITKLDVEASVAKLPRKVECGRVQAFTQRSDVGVCLLRRRSLKSQQRQNQAVLAHCEADSGSLGSADRLAQPVVAPTAQQRVLRSQPPMRELKRRPRVVVEPADQTIIPCIGNICSIQNCKNGGKMRLRY